MNWLARDATPTTGRLAAAQNRPGAGRCPRGASAQPINATVAAVPLRIGIGMSRAGIMPVRHVDITVIAQRQIGGCEPSVVTVEQLAHGLRPES